jgi:uncharacterized protein YbjT (DUF2867 family)
MVGGSGTDRPVILVVGATGAQGGGVARRLLADGRFAVRAFTRNPGSDRARALAERGAEVVAGDLARPETIAVALEGCYGAFGVTSFWEHFDAEYGHGRNLVEAIAGSGVRHFVFSTLPHVHRLTDGALSVPHFDLKGQMEEYARSLDLPATYVHVAFYYENFLGFFPPRRRPDGTWGFGFPQGKTRLAAVAAEDVGGVVAAIFDRPDQFLGKVVGIVGDDQPPACYAEIMSLRLGKPVVYEHVPREVFAALGFRGADDLASMFEYNRTRIPDRRADLIQSRALYPRMRGFDAWTKENAGRLAKVVA